MEQQTATYTIWMENTKNNKKKIFLSKNTLDKCCIIYFFRKAANSQEVENRNKN